MSSALPLAGAPRPGRASREVRELQPLSRAYAAREAPSEQLALATRREPVTGPDPHEIAGLEAMPARQRPGRGDRASVGSRGVAEGGRHGLRALAEELARCADPTDELSHVGRVGRE